MPPLARRSGGETILVVEDEQAVRELTVRILEQLGYTILTASSGAEALEISQAHAGRHHLLLTDVVMPNMSGRQLADIQAARPRRKTLPFRLHREYRGAPRRPGRGRGLSAQAFQPRESARKLREVLAKA